VIAAYIVIKVEDTLQKIPACILWIMSGQIDYKITMKPQCIPWISAPLPPVPTTSTSEFTCSPAVNLPPLTLSDRFVDRDMFMRYRGGGVGHEYMREIEAKYENMSIERDHWDSRSKPPRDNNTDINMDVDAAGSDDKGPKPDPKQSGNSEGGSGGQRSKSAGGSQDGSVNGDDSDDEECVPPESGNSSDNCPTGHNEDSGDNKPVDFEGDPDEIGSDGGYESYGLAGL